MAWFVDWVISEQKRAILTFAGGAVCAFVAGGWTVYQFSTTRADTQRNMAITRRIEARKPFLEKQLTLYFEAAQVAGKMVTMTPEDGEWKAVERRFWSLYWSELSMVEDKAVEVAMVGFSKRLNDYTASYKSAIDKEAHKRPLYGASYELAHAIRSSLERSWSNSTWTPD